MTPSPLPIAPCPNPECRYDKMFASSMNNVVGDATCGLTYWVVCLKCGYQGPKALSEDEAIASHNLIASPDTRDVRERAVKINELTNEILNYVFGKPGWGDGTNVRNDRTNARDLIRGAIAREFTGFRADAEAEEDGLVKLIGKVLVGCSACDYDEANGELLNHCGKCCERITQWLHGVYMGMDGEELLSRAASQHTGFAGWRTIAERLREAVGIIEGLDHGCDDFLNSRHCSICQFCGEQNKFLGEHHD